MANRQMTAMMASPLTLPPYLALTTTRRYSVISVLTDDEQSVSENEMVAGVQTPDEAALDAAEQVREAVTLYQADYHERYGVEETSVRNVLDPTLLSGASRPVGVSLHFLRALVRTLGNNQLRTEDVAEIMTRATAHTKLSVVEAFMPGCMVEHTHFVSHGWRERFCDLVSALEDYHKRAVRVTTIESFQVDHGCRLTIASAKVDDSDTDPARVPYFWLDIFAKNQHMVNSGGTEQELKDMVGMASVFVPVFEKWPNPGVLSRSWCLFEFYHAITQHKPCEPALVSSVRAAIDEGFLKSAGRGAPWVYGTPDNSGQSWEQWDASPQQLQLIENVDFSRAEARFQTDKERIDRSVSDSIGFNELNRVVREALIESLYTARSEMRKKETFEDFYL